MNNLSELSERNVPERGEQEARDDMWGVAQAAGAAQSEHDAGGGATAQLGRGGDQQGRGDPRQGAGAKGAQGLSARAHLLREGPAVALVDTGGGVQAGSPSQTRLRAWQRRGVSWSELRGARRGARAARGSPNTPSQHATADGIAKRLCDNRRWCEDGPRLLTDAYGHARDDGDVRELPAPRPRRRSLKGASRCSAVLQSNFSPKTSRQTACRSWRRTSVCEGKNPRHAPGELGAAASLPRPR